jgi:Major Facilitator Superfamily
VRSLAYGALAVVLGPELARRGAPPLEVGALFSLALVAGAVYSASAGRIVRRFGPRNAAVTGGLLTLLSGLALSGGSIALAAAGCVLGVVSPSGADVGPFAAVEQSQLGSDERHATRHLTWYNVAAGLALAFGALVAAALSARAVAYGYAASGVLIALLALGYPVRDATHAADETPLHGAGAERRRLVTKFGPIEQLAALFAVDAFAGGFIVQSFIAYWFALRFNADTTQLGLLLFGANVLAAGSLFVAERLGRSIGLVRTMVFTHIPSNVLLALVPLMPTYGAAVAVLLARYALSQMDVPTRQAFTLRLAGPAQRVRAAGLTAAVRPAAAAIAPLFAGLAVQGAAFGLPFYLAGGLKIAYDVAVLRLFARHDRP